MRARLTKSQIEMLLNGESLKNGRQRFAIDLKNEELVSTLKTCVQQDSIGKSVNLFLNIDTAEIELESNPS